VTGRRVGVDRRQQGSNWFCDVKGKKGANLVGLLFYSKEGMKIKGTTTANNRWTTDQAGSVADTFVLCSVESQLEFLPTQRPSSFWGYVLVLFSVPPGKCHKSRPMSNRLRPLHYAILPIYFVLTTTLYHPMFCQRQ